MEQPLVSIVIPTYNRAESLRSYCIPAIALLTYPNYEVIIVDDASCDDTQSFLKTCQQNILSITIFRNQRNRGACFSRNLGVANAKGEFVVFIDDDVSLFPDCLDQLVKLYTQDPDVMTVWGCVYQWGDGGNGMQTFGTGSLWSLRRAIFDHFRFDTNLRYFGTTACDEHDLARRIQKHGFKIVESEQAQANHYHAPADNRAWRGLGGDLNYLYENLKSGSILEYYICFLLSVPLAFKRLLAKDKLRESGSQHIYHQVLETPNRLFCLSKQRQFSTAVKWLFYVAIDIPLRAKTRGIIDSLARSYSSTWPAAGFRGRFG